MTLESCFHGLTETLCMFVKGWIVRVSFLKSQLMVSGANAKQSEFKVAGSYWKRTVGDLNMGFK